METNSWGLFTMDVTLIINLSWKKLGEEYEKLFSCFSKDTEKYITFLIPVEREVDPISKNKEEI